MQNTNLKLTLSLAAGLIGSPFPATISDMSAKFHQIFNYCERLSSDILIKVHEFYKSLKICINTVKNFVIKQFMRITQIHCKDTQLFTSIVYLVKTSQYLNLLQ